MLRNCTIHLLHVDRQPLNELGRQAADECQFLWGLQSGVQKNIADFREGLEHRSMLCQMTFGVTGAHVPEIDILCGKVSLSMILHGVKVGEQGVGSIGFKQAFDQSEEGRVLSVEIFISNAWADSTLITSGWNRRWG